MRALFSVLAITFATFSNMAFAGPLESQFYQIEGNWNHQPGKFEFPEVNRSRFTSTPRYEAFLKILKDVSYKQEWKSVEKMEITYFVGLTIVYLQNDRGEICRISFRPGLQPSKRLPKPSKFLGKVLCFEPESGIKTYEQVIKLK